MTTIKFHLISALACVLVLVLSLPLHAQAVDLKGRVLEKANMQPVAGASVKIPGTALTAISGTDGRFAIKGSTSGLRFHRSTTGEAPYLQGADLFFTALVKGQSVRVELCGLSGQILHSADYLASTAGWNRLGIQGWPKEDFLGFARITTNGITRVQRVLHLSGQPQAQWSETARARPLAKAAAGQVDVAMEKLVSKSVPFAADSADLGDIVLDYPARTLIGVGAAMPYGAYMLFDGSKGKAAAQAELKTKWADWIPVVADAELAKYTATRDQFKIAKDPQYPSDTNRVTLQTCCNRVWGYDDIQSVKTHGDAQIHAEFILMGEYDSTENSNVGDAILPAYEPGYNNSGVYAQNRYEVQILSWGQDSTKLPDSHGMGSLVNDYVIAKNPNRANGVWQSYDITFREARYDANKNRTEYARITVWWNGVVVHDNREAHGPATGLANHSGEELNPTRYGLKLQSEGTDVRYRNVWIKDLNLKDAQTKLGY